MSNFFSPIIGISTGDPNGIGIEVILKSLEKINFQKTKSDGYSFQIEMTYRANKKNLKILEKTVKRIRMTENLLIY